MKKALNISEFLAITTVKKTEYGHFMETITDICKYGQAYKGNIKDYVTRYLNYYYDLYLNDITEHNNINN